MLISRKLNRAIHPSLLIDNNVITEVTNHKHLGLNISNNCRWNSHIDYIKDKAWKRINVMRKLKRLLNRKSLEVIYISFIRPILEYGDIIWDNCKLNDKAELDKIQNEAARIVSGTTKLVSISALHSEVGWETLQNRRNNHKLLQFYKMTNGQTPDYLSNLVPLLINDTIVTNLRNANNYIQPIAHTTLYQESFLPSIVRAWNSIPLSARQNGSLSSFKNYLSKKTKVEKYYYHGDRFEQSVHARLRTQCSSLNQHLFMKNIIDSPLCRCGEIESTMHYFFKCPQYTNIRTDLINSLSNICTLTTDVLLFGNRSSTYDVNIKIFDCVHRYIRESKRF